MGRNRFRQVQFLHLRLLYVEAARMQPSFLRLHSLTNREPPNQVDAERDLSASYGPET